MSYTYITKQGDTWDQIAHDELGDGFRIGELMWANSSLMEQFIFPAGVELTIPDIEPVYEDADDELLPDWREDANADDADADDDEMYEDDDDSDYDDASDGDFEPDPEDL